MKELARRHPAISQKKIVTQCRRKNAKGIF
jgi:hypothetical protein